MRLPGKMGAEFSGGIMTAKLSKEQRQALAEMPEQPLAVEDPETHRRYVLIRTDLFEQLQHQAKVPKANHHNRTAATKVRGTGLPEWCNVFEGLSAKKIAGIEKVIQQRADLTRPS